MSQPDGTVSLCRPLEQDVYEQVAQQARKSKGSTVKNSFKGCFCLHQRSSQPLHPEAEEWSRPRAQLIQ